jgi:hypothetical protein
MNLELTRMAPAMGASWETRPLPPPTTGRSDALPPPPVPAAANWLILDSDRADVRLRITEHELFVGDRRLASADISNVAFWTAKQHEIVLVTPGIRLSFCLRNSRTDTTPAAQDFATLVKYLDTRVLPRLVQQRLQRLDMGMTVEIGPIKLRRAGIQSNRRTGRDHMPWADFDRAVVERDEVTIMRRRKSRIVPFAKIDLADLDAVLLPMLLRPAAGAFG